MLSNSISLTATDPNPLNEPLHGLDNYSRPSNASRIYKATVPIIETIPCLKMRINCPVLIVFPTKKDTANLLPPALYSMITELCPSIFHDTVIVLQTHSLSELKGIKHK